MSDSDNDEAVNTDEEKENSVSWISRPRIDIHKQALRLIRIHGLAFRYKNFPLWTLN